MHSFLSAPRRSLGITVIEMMIVVALVGVLAALAIPNLFEFFINIRLNTAANELVAALSTARSEAIRRGSVVTMHYCGSIDASTGCAEKGSQPEEWGNGWYMFVDPDRSKAASEGEELLRIGHAVPNPLTIYQGRSFGGKFVPTGTISFCPNGRLFGLSCEGATATQDNTPTILVICYDNELAVSGKPRSRVVLVNIEGRVRLAVHDGQGYPLNESDGVRINGCKDGINY